MNGSPTEKQKSKSVSLNSEREKKQTNSNNYKTMLKNAQQTNRITIQYVKET